jgi:dipeptidyl aminopeptidase/acylaminoacyl peptidase
LDKRILGRQESILYKARDGKEIGGLLIHPIGKVAKGGAPLIIQVHGGPESHYRNGWVTSYSNLGQVAAGRGFAVFYPNYRGSTGRGVAYSKADHGDPAGKEFDDIVDGIDYLAGRGIVDKERVGCMGGSYGGYASAWAATYYSHRYKAAAVFVGVADQISKIGTTDITNEMISVHFRKKPWEHWDFFLKRSPIYHAHKSTTATLILHGKADTRVDPGQSRELYRHLKLRGKAPVRLVLYPGEGHGNRKAAARFDYHLRTLRWMEHFLKGNKKAMPGSDLEYKKALGIK